jgi:hypothetical protein
MANLSSFYPQPVVAGTTEGTFAEGDDARIVGALPAATAGTGSVLASGSNTARTLSARFGEMVNVKDYGVAGDGVTNDQPAIQALLDSKDVIYFPEGTYAIFNAPEPSPVVAGSIACFTVHRNGSRIILHPKAVLKHTWTGTFTGRRFVDIRASDVVWDGGTLDGGYDFAGQGTIAVMNGPNGTERTSQNWSLHNGITIADQSYSSLLSGKVHTTGNKPTADDMIPVIGIQIKNLTIKQFRQNGSLINGFAYLSGGILYPTRQKGFRDIVFENVTHDKNVVTGAYVDAADEDSSQSTRYDYPNWPLTDSIRKPIENISYIRCKFLETGRVDSNFLSGGNGCGCGGMARNVLYDNCIFRNAGRIGVEVGGTEATNVTFKKCDFRRGYYRAVSFGGSNTVVDNCFLQDANDFHEIFPTKILFTNNHVEGLLLQVPVGGTKKRAANYTIENNFITSIDESKPTLDPDTPRIVYNATGKSSSDLSNPNVITAVGHNFLNGNRVRFLSISGGGLNTSTTYFVRDVSGNTFKLSLSSGGVVENLSSDIISAKITRVHLQRGAIGLYKQTNLKIANNTIVNIHQQVAEFSGDAGAQGRSAIELYGGSQIQILNNFVISRSPTNTTFLNINECSDVVVSGNYHELQNYNPSVATEIRFTFAGVKRLTYEKNTIDCTQISEVSISNANPAVVSWNSHNLQNGDVVRFETSGSFFATGTLPSQIKPFRKYYVVDKTSDNFKLAESPSGSQISTSGGGGSGIISAVGYTKHLISQSGFGFTGANPALRKRTWGGSSWSEEPIAFNISTDSRVSVATSSIVGDGTTATVTTAANHGLPNGTSIVVITGAVDAGFNGRHTVTNNLISTSSIVGNGTTATVTTATNHQLPSGTSTVSITGAVPDGFNGTRVVTNTGSNTFTFSSTVNATASVQGSVNRLNSFTFASAINATASVQGVAYKMTQWMSNTPHPFPNNGEIFVIGEMPTGVWADYPAHFATWNGSWSFTPIKNVFLYNDDFGSQNGQFVSPDEEPTYATGQPSPLVGESWLKIKGGLIDSTIKDNVFTNNGRITYTFDGGVLAPLLDEQFNIFWNCTFENNDVMPRYQSGNSGSSNFFHCRAIGKPSRTIPTFLSIKGAFVQNLTNTGGWRNNRGTTSNAWDIETPTKSIISTVAPSSIPEFIGQQYINTASGIAYIATGTSSSSDWKALATWNP